MAMGDHSNFEWIPVNNAQTMVSVLCIAVILLQYITSLIGEVHNTLILFLLEYNTTAPNWTCFKEFPMENQQRAAFSLDVTSDLYPWALLTEVGTTERSGKPCIPPAVSKFSNPKKPDLLVEEPERHCNKSEKEEVLPMASLEPELPRPKTVSGKQEVVLPKQQNEILEQSQPVPKHLESVPQQSTDVGLLEQLKQVPQKSMKQKQEIKRSEMILEKPNDAVPQQPEINKQSKQVPQKSEPIPQLQPNAVKKTLLQQNIC
jgi:hypothetical protein